MLLRLLAFWAEENTHGAGNKARPACCVKLEFVVIILWIAELNMLQSNCMHTMSCERCSLHCMGSQVNPPR